MLKRVRSRLLRAACASGQGKVNPHSIEGRRDVESARRAVRNRGELKKWLAYPQAYLSYANTGDWKKLLTVYCEVPDGHVALTYDEGR